MSDRLKEAAGDVLSAYAHSEDIGSAIFELSRAWFRALGPCEPSLEEAIDQLSALLVWQGLPGNVELGLLVDVIKQLRKARPSIEATCLSCGLTFPEDEVECPTCGAERVADLDNGDRDAALAAAQPDTAPKEGE